LCSVHAFAALSQAVLQSIDVFRPSLEIDQTPLPPSWMPRACLGHSTHPIRGVELRALRELRRIYQDSPYVFVTEREGPMTPASSPSSPSRATPTCCGMRADTNGPARARTRARSSNTSGTETSRTRWRYTELSPDRFKTFWKD